MSEDRRQAQSKSGLPAASPGELPAGEDPREVQRKSDRPATGPGLLRPAPSVTQSVAPAVAPARAAPVANPEPPLAPSQAPPVAPPQAPPVAPPLAPANSAGAAAATDLEPDYDEDDLQLTLADRLRRLSPAPVLLTLGSIGSLLFDILAVTSHTTPVAVLMSAGVVTGLIFGANAVIASMGTWRATQDGEYGRALLLAGIGGVSALVSTGALAALLVMVLLLNS
jgi:hypothetical protein